MSLVCTTFFGCQVRAPVGGLPRYGIAFLGLHAKYTASQAPDGMLHPQVVCSSTARVIQKQAKLSLSTTYCTVQIACVVCCQAKRHVRCEQGGCECERSASDVNQTHVCVEYRALGSDRCRTPRVLVPECNRQLGHIVHTNYAKQGHKY
jgi:hypothetical protein